jgi:glycosyltransferase involved in cell wall biosynthesis
MSIHHRLDRSSGAAGSTLELADHYREMGHDVTVWSYDDLPGTIDLRAAQIAFPLWMTCRLVSTAALWDVIDASTGDAWPWIALRRPRGRVRAPVLVTRSHGLEHAADRARREEAKVGHLDLSWRYGVYWGGLHLREVDTTLRGADGVLFLNDNDRDFAISELGVDSRTAFVAANGISDAFHGLPAPREATAKPSDVAVVGTFSPRKGATYLVRATVDIIRRRPETTVAFVGTGVPGDEVLRDFPEDVRPRIKVTSRYESAALPSLLAPYAICLFASVSEGFGKSLLEAMACGLAPVAAAAPGPASLITDDCGALVPVGDAGALADEVIKLIDDPGRRHAYAIAAQARAQLFTWDTSARRRLEIYEELREGRRRIVR